MNRPADTGREPGIRAVKIASAEERTSKAGNAMITIELVDPDTERFVLRDFLMLSGDGWGYGKAKFWAFGIEEGFQGDLEPESLVGRVAFVATRLTEYNGKQRLAPDVDQGHAGYFRANEPPPGHEPIEATRRSAPEPGDEDFVPF
jgi:hypothetical protein